MSELQLLTAREFGFEGHKAVKDLHSLIIKPEVLKAWVEYEDGARPHLPVSFESQLDPNFEYNYALCTAAVKIFRIPRREVLYPGLADRKDLYDCQLRFIICFMDFATQPGELWEGRLVTQRCFRRALALLRFIEYEMSKRKAKCPSSTRKVMFKALKNYNVSLNVPHAKTLPASASVAAAQPQGIDEPVSTSMGAVIPSPSAISLSAPVSSIICDQSTLTTTIMLGSSDESPHRRSRRPKRKTCRTESLPYSNMNSDENHGPIPKKRCTKFESVKRPRYCTRFQSRMRRSAGSSMAAQQDSGATKADTIKEEDDPESWILHSQTPAPQTPVSTTGAHLQHYEALIQELVSKKNVLTEKLSALDVNIAQLQEMVRSREATETELDAVQKRVNALVKVVAALADPDLADQNAEG